MKRAVPLLVFVLLVALLAAGLRLDPALVPSPLIGKPAPSFSLPQLGQQDRRVSPADFHGRVWVLNVWASWCVSCIAEHPLLVDLLQDRVTLVGLNYKDDSRDAIEWLARRGDPYTVSAVDEAGAAGLDWGVYGVPETFVIDTKGMIRFKHVGALERSTVTNEILPLVTELRSEAIVKQ